MNACTHTHTYTHTHTCIHAHTHIHTCPGLSVQKQNMLQMTACKSLRSCTFIYMYIRSYICVYIYTYICSYMLHQCAVKWKCSNVSAYICTISIFVTRHCAATFMHAYTAAVFMICEIHTMYIFAYMCLKIKGQ
jgi:hypothetical protein